MTEPQTGIIRGSVRGRNLAEAGGRRAVGRGEGAARPWPRCSPAPTGRCGPAQGGKRLPMALGGLSDGCVCCSALHVRMVKTVVKMSCCLSELKES